MKRKTALCFTVGAAAAAWAVAGCLIPPGQQGLLKVDTKPCLPPAAPAKAVHNRTDIDWPTAQCRQTAADLLAKMSLEEKAAQMVQPDRMALQNDHDIGTFGVGSVLNGGSSDPNTGNGAGSWAQMTAVGHMLAMEGEHKIPLLYGVDAVHGHNNVIDAVVFPHNIGLGATRNPELVERVGRAAAEEIAATGIDWTFSPVLAAARDERWGRTYEAFGETPELAAEMGAAMIRGLQGERLGAASPSVLACAKHFAGDGGTDNGRDQGDATGDLETFKELHISQYKAAVDAGVGSVMASYSSFNGVRMHCHGPTLTDILKNELGFNGFVVSDWEAVEKLPGSYREQVASAVNAGLDMVMAPRSYTGLINTIKTLVPEKISEARIDDAVGRILAVKCELGMFEPDYFPQDGVRRYLLAKLGSSEHREIARAAVRESVVMLKNDNDVLPLARDLNRIVIAGRNSDDVGHQCGGWTISWQGSTGAITKGTSVRKAIQKVLSPTGQGGEIVFSENGSAAEPGDIAVAVIGEGPYAEGNGDRKNLALSKEDADTVRTLKENGAKVIVVLISGRPMILDSVLDNSDALLAAWLPGTEADGIADILFGAPPTGKLPHSWPRSMAQIPINFGDAAYDPLFPYGFGLTYGETEEAAQPDTEEGPPPADNQAADTDTDTDEIPSKDANTESPH